MLLRQQLGRGSSSPPWWKVTFMCITPEPNSPLG